MTAPLLLGALALYGAAQGVDLFDALTHGARKGLLLLWEMLPTLLILFAVLDLFRASGLPELLSRLLSPVLEALGIPRETGLLMLLRPLSGSAALSAAYCRCVISVVCCHRAAAYRNASRFSFISTNRRRRAT